MSAATDAVPFSAGTNTGNPINWIATLRYATSGGRGSITDPRTFMTTSGQPPNPAQAYQSEGGQMMKATAQTTASDGSTTLTDCVTFYVEGPAGGIPNATITAQLDTLYPASSSYQRYRNDGTATPSLMTGVAMKESSYKQFLTPAEPPINPDLFNLYANFGIAAKWPLESQVGGVSDGGSHIGLMMFPTSSGDAWNWQTNTNHGVNDTQYGFAGAAVPLANSIANQIITGSKQNGFPAHTPLVKPTGLQLENMALVLYGPFAHSTVWTLQYYIPLCTSPGVITRKNNTWTCMGASWHWAINDPSIDTNVKASNIGPGVTVFGNPDGVSYSNTVRSLIQ